MLKINEINHMNGFVIEEVPKSIGIKYAPIKIKSYFNIKPKNGEWFSRKKK